jgi:hypothetical protein
MLAQLRASYRLRLPRPRGVRSAGGTERICFRSGTGGTDCRARGFRIYVFRAWIYLVGLCESFRTANRSRRNVGAVFGFYLQNTEAFFFHQPKQRAHASAIHEGRLRTERRDS